VPRVLGGECVRIPAARRSGDERGRRRPPGPPRRAGRSAVARNPLEEAKRRRPPYHQGTRELVESDPRKCADAVSVRGRLRFDSVDSPPTAGTPAHSGERHEERAGRRRRRSAPRRSRAHARRTVGLSKRSRRSGRSAAARRTQVAPDPLLRLRPPRRLPLRQDVSCGWRGRRSERAARDARAQRDVPRRVRSVGAPAAQGTGRSFRTFSNQARSLARPAARHSIDGRFRELGHFEHGILGRVGCVSGLQGCVPHLRRRRRVAGLERPRAQGEGSLRRGRLYEPSGADRGKSVPPPANALGRRQTS